MRIDVTSGSVDQVRNAVPVFVAFEGEQRPEKLLPPSAAKDAGLLARLGESGFRGALNDTTLLPLGKGWLIVVGAGKAKDLSLERVRQLSATAARFGRSRRFSALALPLLHGERLGDAETVAHATTEGALLGLYRYDRYRTLPKHEQAKRVDAITIVAEQARDATGAKRGAAKGQVIAESVAYARDLINGPGNVITPAYLANEAKRIAKEFKLKCEVIPFEELKRQGFGGIVGVGQGSANPPCFIVLEYAPTAKPKATFALCGKGITFDSGGISIKPADKMEQMKYDMSGAAAVLGTMKAAATLKLPARVIGIIGAAENLPSATSQRPGDILKTLSGKTVEVINTDAEGRLVLADCLHYAKRYKPDCVVDLATLTGACVIALGSEAIGLFSKDERVVKRITDAGETTHERVWRLPLWDEYLQIIKSDVADLKNAGNREAGATTAAKFLEEFAEGLPWAHLDIAGTAWTERDKPYNPKGAVGVGVRLLVNLMERW